MKDVALKILWVSIIIVSVVADDVGILDNILQINQSCLVGQGYKRVGEGPLLLGFSASWVV